MSIARNKSSDLYGQFCTNFLKAIKAGNDEEADKIMESSAAFSVLIKKMKPFDAQLETLIENGTLTDKEKKIAKMCTYLNKHELSTRFSQLCHFGASIRIKGEKPVLSGRTIAWLKQEAKAHISVYETYESSIGPRIKFMNDIRNYKPIKEEEKF